MSGEDLRKIMNLMESSEASETEELDESFTLDEGVVGMDTDAVLWHLFELGRNAGTVMGSKAEAKARQIQQELVAVFGPTVGTVGEAIDAHSSEAQF